MPPCHDSRLRNFFGMCVKYVSANINFENVSKTASKNAGLKLG